MALDYSVQLDDEQLSIKILHRNNLLILAESTFFAYFSFSQESSHYNDSPFGSEMN